MTKLIKIRQQIGIGHIKTIWFLFYFNCSSIVGKSYLAKNQLIINDNFKLNFNFILAATQLDLDMADTLNPPYSVQLL